MMEIRNWEEFNDTIRLLKPLVGHIVRVEKLSTKSTQRRIPVKVGKRIRGKLRVVNRFLEPAFLITGDTDWLLSSVIKSVTEHADHILIETVNSEYKLTRVVGTNEEGL